MKGTESTRLSIRKRGRSLGHHQALEKEERFTSWRHEEMGRLDLDARRDGGRACLLRRELDGRRRRRAERDGAGGLDGGLLRDGAGARSSSTASRRDGRGRGRSPRSDHASASSRSALQIMRRAGAGGPFDAGPDLPACSSDRDKRTLAAQLLGQAYMRAHLPRRRRTGRPSSTSPTSSSERRELHGDEVLELLDDAELRRPARSISRRTTRGRSCRAGRARTACPGRGRDAASAPPVEDARDPPFPRSLPARLPPRSASSSPAPSRGSSCCSPSPVPSPTCPGRSGSPTDEAEMIPQQIADHVGGAATSSPTVSSSSASRLPPPRIQDVPIGAIAARQLPPAAPGARRPLIDIFPAGRRWSSSSAGLGQNCAIEEGTPSTNACGSSRRRRSSSRSTPSATSTDTNYVVAFLPPSAGEQPSLCALLPPRRSRGTARPAARGPRCPPRRRRRGGDRPSEVVTIDQLTGTSLFRFQFQQLQDGTAVLVLNDPTVAPLPSATQTGETQPAETGATTGSP